MKCISSPALDDTQIVAYIEGEADDGVVAHIRECAFCNEKATEWSHLQNGLQRQLYRITCPTSIELGDYYLGLLSDSQKLVVTQHVRQCPLCRQEVVRLEGFLGDLDRGDDPLGTAKMIIARIISGTTGESVPTLTALRGESTGPITLEGDGIVIILDFQPTNQAKINLLGQVASENQDQWTGAVVELYQDGKQEFSTTVDDLGAFHAEGIMPGFKELRIVSKNGSFTVVSNFETLT
jgi:hypothetical protein